VGGLPANRTVNGFAVDPENPKVMYVAMRDGLFKSTDAGEIWKSVGEGHRDFFERTSGKGHHDHMVCTRCGKFIEFACEEIEKLQEKVCADYGFKLIFHDHRLFGFCRNCAGKEKTGVG